MNKLNRGLLRTAFAIVLLAVAGVAQATTITFSEAVFNGAGFNGQNNNRLLSVDGAYLVDFFWLNTSGHDHIFSGVENNHNQSGAVGLSQLQGLRVSSLDGMNFDLVSMDILNGQASVGQLTNQITGAGVWTGFNSGAIVFGGAFDNVNAIYIADPFAAFGAGSGFNNQWDNIVLQKSAVPEPLSVSLLVLGLLGLGIARRKCR